MVHPRQNIPGQISVWIVEDNDDYRSTIYDLIEAEQGLSCPHAFGSAEELLTHLDGHFPGDVLLLDVGLPGMNGVEAVKKVTEMARGMAIIMLTVHEDNDRVFGALCAGASGYLSKTASSTDIIEAIRDVVRGGASMSPQIARRVVNMFAQLQTPPKDYGLTVREKEVLRLLVDGKSKKRIAHDLALSIHTVDTHVRNIYAKLHVNTQASAVRTAMGERLIR
jgi:DNA-binding NarL/FixJ family response regulator